MEGRYSADGYYMHNGMRGEQSGELEIFPDGKLIGKIMDTDDNRKEMEKLVLGVCLDESRRITFLKIAPGLRRGNDIMPVMWDLRTTNPEKSVYTGHFGFLGDDFPLLDEIEKRLYFGVDLGNLRDISPNTLRTVYFNQGILERLEVFARERGWGGELVLSPKSS